MPLQSHLNTTLLITNILKMLLINGAGVVPGGGVVRGVEWYGGWSGTGGGVVRGVE